MEQIVDYPSLLLSDQEAQGEGEMNKLDLNYILWKCKISICQFQYTHMTHDIIWTFTVFKASQGSSLN